MIAAWKRPHEERFGMPSSKKKGPVEKIALQCTECKQKNYTTEKKLNKYCPFERKHTLHRETKIK